MALDALTAATQLLIQEGNEETALQVLALVQSHRVTTYATRNRAQQLLNELEPHMSLQTVTTAFVQAKTRQIEEVIQALLANELSVQPELGRPEFQEINQQLSEALTVRELEIVQLIDSGLSNEEIAKRLIIGVSTVKKHINHLYAKLDVASRTQAVRRAREMHLL